MITVNAKGVLLALGLAAVSTTPLAAADSIKLGLIEPMSGPIAALGRDANYSFNFWADQVNEAGGVLGGRKLEVVALDNAMNAEKTTQQLKKAADTGIRYIIQGIGSNHALNIIKFADKHNKRNPDKSILFLNHSAVTTAFTNELCSFWHFRFDANVDMKVAALTTHMGKDSSIEKVYMINQNYAYGKSFQAAARKFLPERAPGVELVGDELIVPFGKVQDFTPFIAKIKASGADTVLTGNWGPDIQRLVKSASDSGLDVQFYSIYGGLTSSIAAYGEVATRVRLKQVTEMHRNDDAPGVRASSAVWDAYEAKYRQTFYADRQRWLIHLLAAAIDKAGSDEPVAVGRALEGLTFEGPLGKVVMRANDHQIQMPMVISSLTTQYRTPVVYDGRDFGVAFSTDGHVSREDTTLATTCQMNRPG